jgi:hypothetical protein
MGYRLSGFGQKFNSEKKWGLLDRVLGEILIWEKLGVALHYANPLKNQTSNQGMLLEDLGDNHGMKFYFTIDRYTDYRL